MQKFNSMPSLKPGISYQYTSNPRDTNNDRTPAYDEKPTISVPIVDVMEPLDEAMPLVKVSIHRGYSLPRTSTFLKLYFGDNNTALVYNTRVIKGTIEPRWEEETMLRIEKHFINPWRLNVECYRESIPGVLVKIGHFGVDLVKDLYMRNVMEKRRWKFNLNTQGKIELSLQIKRVLLFPQIAPDFIGMNDVKLDWSPRPLVKFTLYQLIGLDVDIKIPAVFVEVVLQTYNGTFSKIIRSKTLLRTKPVYNSWNPYWDTTAVIKYQTRCDTLHINVYYKEKKKKLYQQKLLVLSINDIFYYATSSETRKWFSVDYSNCHLGLGLQALTDLSSLHLLPEPPAKGGKKWLKYLDENLLNIALDNAVSPLPPEKDTGCQKSDMANDAYSDLSIVYPNPRHRTASAPEVWGGNEEADVPVIVEKTLVPVDITTTLKNNDKTSSRNRLSYKEVPIQTNLSNREKTLKRVSAIQGSRDMPRSVSTSNLKEHYQSLENMRGKNLTRAVTARPVSREEFHINFTLQTVPEETKVTTVPVERETGNFPNGLPVEKNHSRVINVALIDSVEQAANHLKTHRDSRKMFVRRVSSELLIKNSLTATQTENTSHPKNSVPNLRPCKSENSIKKLSDLRLKENISRKSTDLREGHVISPRLTSTRKPLQVINENPGDKFKCSACHSLVDITELLTLQKVDFCPPCYAEIIRLARSKGVLHKILS